MITDLRNKEVQIYSCLDQSDTHSTKSIADDENYAIMLMSSQEESFVKLPSLNSALKTDYLPIEFGQDLRPLLPLPEKSKGEEHLMEDSNGKIYCTTLPPLKIPCEKQADILSFVELNMGELSHHLEKENIPDTQGERALTLHKEMFENSMMKYTSISKIIAEYVLPKWTQYLFLKNQRKEA